MKKIFPFLLAAVLTLSLTACGSSNVSPPPSVTQSPPPSPAFSAPTASISATSTLAPEAATSAASAPATSTAQASNTLVVYFSRVGVTQLDDSVDAVSSASLNLQNGEFVGNCEIVANMAAAATGADVFQIVTEQTYPASYRDTTNIAQEEQQADARPALASHVENMQAYDTILLVYPNWWGTLPMALCTFLEEYDFSGKIIAPICTHEGSGMGSSESDIAALCPDATLQNGLAIRGSAVSDAQGNVQDWLRELGIAEA